nr:hypothetical protein [Tanacetum cinerariifolium]
MLGFTFSWFKEIVEGGYGHYPMDRRVRRSCDQAGSLEGKGGSRATVHLNLGTGERL